VDALLAEAPPASDVPAPAGAPRPLSAESRTRLGVLRQKLLSLHKALLDDARSTYELDRGRISSPGQLLQLVINDPWFAWLHQISELIVRMDDVAAPNGTGAEADALALFEQLDHLLVPSETGDAFARKYFEALQRQPAVVLAHGDVRRALRES
jgi:hypothetical protein